MEFNIPVNITTGVAPLLDMPAQNVHLDRVLRTRLQLSSLLPFPKTEERGCQAVLTIRQ